MNDKQQKIIAQIVRLCAQDKAFDKELRKQLSIAPVAELSTASGEQLEEIYEYCIAKVVQRQAQEFYADMPSELQNDCLVEDFCRMEAFRRKGCFGDFALALYQQLEHITNCLFADTSLQSLIPAMWHCSAYVNSQGLKDDQLSVANRTNSTYTIARLLFFDKANTKCKTPLSQQTANDKMRIVVYFVGYKAMMKSSDYSVYLEQTKLLKEIYLCRNMNHRGSTQTPYAQDTLEHILSHQSVYYLKFLGALTQFVEQIKEGWPTIPSTLSYAQTLPY